MSISERYLTSTNSSNLRVKAEKVSDADTILAAGYAASGDPRKSLALKLWRMKQTGKQEGFGDVAAQCVEMMHTGNRGIRISDAKAKDITRKTLFWWLNPVCAPCDGLGHPLIPNTPHLNYSAECDHCGGTGVTPLEGLIAHQYINHGRRLADELNRLSAVVFSDMARRLNNSMEL